MSNESLKYNKSSGLAPPTFRRSPGALLCPPNSPGLYTAGIVMHKGVRFIGALIAVSVLVAISGTAAPQSDLGGTSWTASNEGCDLGIDFRSDGTADIIGIFGGASDTGHWTLDGDALNLKYDNWYGGIEGTKYGDNRIEATETWQSKETKVVHNDPCIFEKDK